MQLNSSLHTILTGGDLTITIFLLILAFFIGSIPSGFIIGKIRGVDIRSIGSGNIGATNVARALGARAGALTLVCDVFKGILATSIPLLFGAQGMALSPICAVGAVAGHCFSPFLRFRGGKGVATGLGAFLIVSPVAAAFSAVAFIAVVKITRYVSLASMSAGALLVLVLKDDRPEIFASALIAVGIIVLRHRTNIARLLRGTEVKQSRSQKVSPAKVVD